MNDVLYCDNCGRPIDLSCDCYNAYEDGTVLCPECVEIKEVSV